MGSSDSLTALKRKGLVDSLGVDIYDKLKERKVQAHDVAAKAKLEQARTIAQEAAQDYYKAVVDSDRPFVGAQPKLLRHPEVATAAQTARATQVTCRNLAIRIDAAAGVHVICAQDSSYSEGVRALLGEASDEVADLSSAPVVVSMNNDWLQTLPHTERPELPTTGERLLIYLGTPGKYLTMCIRSGRGAFDAAYAGDRLVVLCRGVCMMPLGSQQQNVFGVDEQVVTKAVITALHAKGEIAWGHGVNTKAGMMEKAFGYLPGGALPSPLDFSGDTGGSTVHFDYFTEYIKYLNLVKLAKPTVPVTNYYDTGLLVSVLTGSVVQQGPSLLMDRDGLAILRESSIGHIMSKLSQLSMLPPYSSSRGVYNFFIGDGAAFLNGGVELAMHLIEGYQADSLMTLFIFNNHKWAIEDNIVSQTVREHHLYNKVFYDLLEQHDNVCICEDDLELRETLAFLSRRTNEYLQGSIPPGMVLVIVRGLDIQLPPMLGDIDAVIKSPEMKLMRDVLGNFAKGCRHKVPIYACSAFEYIQYLHLFLEKMPEGKQYHYACGRSDIQANHMCGFTQPDGKCVLFANDVYGLHGLGESLRLIMAGFGGKQVLIFFWHPSLLQVIDHFHLHRPPMVWPSMGPEFCRYFVRKDTDVLYVEFEGFSTLATVASQVNVALESGTPLVVVNMLPEQERNYLSLDIRVKTEGAQKS